MKQFYLFTLLCILSLYSNAQNSGTIFGLARKSTPSSVYLAKINPSSGAVANISATSISVNFGGGGNTIDTRKNIFYYTSSNKFVGVDLATGNVVSSPIIQSQVPSPFNGFYYNCSDSTIYGLTSGAGGIYLAKINPLTGVVTTISASRLAIAFLYYEITLDPINEIFYFMTTTNLIGVSLATGAIVSSSGAIQTINGSSLRNMHFNIADGAIYGFAGRPGMPGFYLAKINPTNGVITYVSTTPISTTTSYNIAGATIDPVNNIYYGISNGSFIGVSTQTGNKVSSAVIANTAADYFDLFKFKGSYCSSNSSADSTNNNPPITNNNTTKEILTYPNPFGNETTMKMNTSVTGATIMIFNSFGNMVRKIDNVTGKIINFKRNGLKAGLYFMQVVQSGKTIMKSQFMIMD